MIVKQSRASLEHEPGFTLFAAAIVGVGVALFGVGHLVDYWAWGRATDAWLAVALMIIGLFIAQLSRTLQIRKRLASKANTRFDLGFREQFIYTFVTLIILTTLAFYSGTATWGILEGLRLNGNGHEEFSALQVFVLLLSATLSFVPMAVATYVDELEASAQRTKRWPDLEKETRRSKTPLKPTILRPDSISVPSFYLGAALTGTIVSLAIWAANVSQAEHEGIAQHLAFQITLGVVALFVVLIFLPHVQSYLDNLGDQPTQGTALEQTPLPLKALPTLASWADSVLVRLVAPLSGATQTGPLIPHVFVLCAIVPLTALGFALPPPWGLVPIVLGMLMVFALGRRWAWVEADRETASRLQQTQSPEIHVGFDNDLKDEALLGYASLFILVPLALYQINGISGAFQGLNGGPISDPFFSWLSFFGGELAKAVPFVDWWEIYDVKIQVPIESSTQSKAAIDAAKHLTFAARAVVDLVIMAALFQAVGIWQRSRTQETLYDAGQIDVFDPFLEERFFRRGMRRLKGKWVPTEKFERRLDDRKKKRAQLGLSLIPYSERRLTELIEHTSKEVRAGAEWMVETYDVLVGKPNRKLSLLVKHWEKAPAEHGAALGSQVYGSVEWRRAQKPRLELVISELLGEDRVSQPTLLTDLDVGNLIRVLQYCGDASEFFYARIEIVELLGQADRRTPNAFLALVAQTCPISAEYKGWHELLIKTFGLSVIQHLNNQSRYAGPYFGREQERKRCYDAMQDLGGAYFAHRDHPILELIEQYLRKRKDDEAVSYARPSAEAAYEDIYAMRRLTAPPETVQVLD